MPETGEPLAYATNYQADDLNNHFELSARRSGERLLVRFTDTSDQDRRAVEAPFIMTKWVVGIAGYCSARQTIGP